MQEILTELPEILLHQLIETLKMAPILFLAYLFMEWLEKSEGSRFSNVFNNAKKSGPLFGALLGLIPQCGFSGAVASMYAAGAVTLGTLLSVILSTSDEMLPLFISGATPLRVIALVLGLKFIIGIICGFTVDFFVRKNNAERDEDIHGFCEREHCSCKDGIFKSALRHSLRIIVIIYIISLFLHLAVHLIPQETLKYILNFPVLSEIAAALIGLIPSCAISVTLTSLYMNGALGLAPLLCGLLSNGGIGLLVLFRTNKNIKNSLFIALLLFLSGLIFGSLAGHLFGGLI